LDNSGSIDLMFDRRFLPAGLLVSLALMQGCVSTPTEPSTRTPAPPLEPGTYMVFGEVYRTQDESRGYLEIGVASWYGKKFHGRLTSNGEIYDMYALSAAHKTLPLPTFVKVTNLDNGRKVVIRINDRGPFHDDRLIDLSFAAAQELGFADKGIAPVVVEALDVMNYPDEDLSKDETSYYLQVGAFSDRRGAEALSQRIEALMAQQRPSAPVSILESELEQGSLHKVWIGPINDLAREEEIAALLVEANIGNPMKIEVD
jgi:rare lipoprotein A